MNEARKWAASAVFEGRVVVCGGYVNGAISSTAEAYDVTAGRWRRVASMVESKRGHRCAAVRNKLYAIGG